MSFLKKLFGGSSTDFKSMIQNGAKIIDVRTPGEYASGHIKGSINIPLQQLEKNLSKIPKDSIIITCCASGMRSASAKNVLKAKGYQEVYNGGGWSSLKSKIQ